MDYKAASCRHSHVKDVPYEWGMTHPWCKCLNCGLEMSTEAWEGMQRTRAGEMGPEGEEGEENHVDLDELKRQSD